MRLSNLLVEWLWARMLDSVAIVNRRLPHYWAASDYSSEQRLNFYQYIEDQQRMDSASQSSARQTQPVYEDDSHFHNRLSTFGTEHILSNGEFTQLVSSIAAITTNGEPLSSRDLWSSNLEEVPSFVFRAMLEMNDADGASSKVNQVLPQRVSLRPQEMDTDGSTTYYSVNEFPKLSVRYQWSGSSVDPSLSTYWFQRILNQKKIWEFFASNYFSGHAKTPAQITPKVVYVSPRIAVPDLQVAEWRAEFDKLIAAAKREFIQRRGVTNEAISESNGDSIGETRPVYKLNLPLYTVPTKDQIFARYVVMESVGPSIASVSPMDLGSAVRLVQNVIEVIRRIHAKNILHGSVSESVFVFGSRSGRRNAFPILAIDFDRGKIFNEAEILASNNNDPNYDCIGGINVPVGLAKSNSLWQHFACAYSFRDELFRAMMILPSLVFGSPHKMAIYNMSIEQIVGIKRSGKIFELPGSANFHLGEFSRIVRTILEVRIMQELILPLRVLERPNYERINQWLNRILQVIEGDG